MDKQNLMPQAAQPVNRTTTGPLPDVLAELSEEALQLIGGDSGNAVSEHPWCRVCSCSYDGDDAE
jgi:bacteriocin leader peptide (microcyclamide/patellamide family)